MANSPSWVREIRFLIDKDGDELIHAYVFTECPDFPLAHGWRTKTFGKSSNVLQILTDEIGKSKHHTEWNVGAPPTK